MTEKTTPDASRVEVSVAKQEKTSVDLGGGTPTASTSSTAATTLEIGDDELEVRTGLGEEGGDDTVEGSDTVEGGEQDPNDPPKDDTPEDLGEWNPEDEETKSKFDSRYFTESGELNKEALGSEFWANYAKAEDKAKAGLNEATYAYLKDTLGVSKEFVKEVERGLVAARGETEQAFLQKVGGAEKYNAAINWAKSGGYSEDQQKRFNELLSKGGPEFDDAVDALMARFERAVPGPQRRGPPRRGSTPQRDVTGNATTGAKGGDVFKNTAEYSTAFNEAIRAERQAQTPQEKREAKKKVEDIRAKARRSNLK